MFHYHSMEINVSIQMCPDKLLYPDNSYAPHLITNISHNFVFAIIFKYCKATRLDSMERHDSYLMIYTWYYKYINNRKYFALLQNAMVTSNQSSELIVQQAT